MPKNRKQSPRQMADTAALTLAADKIITEVDDSIAQGKQRLRSEIKRALYFRGARIKPR